MSRGIRNNNPGNIDYSPKNKWLGELPFNPAIESRHCRFTKPEYGIRALFKLLRSYSKYPGKRVWAAEILTPWKKLLSAGHHRKTVIIPKGILSGL